MPVFGYKNVTTSVIGNTDTTLAGATGAAIDLGNVFPTLMDLPALTAYLTTKVYTGASGTGQQNLTLALASAGSAYDTWKAANASGSNPDEDTDGDGVSNAVEFVLGGTSATNDLAKLPIVATDGTNMTFTFVRDETSVEASTVVTIEVSNDLVNWKAGSSPYAVPDADTAGPVNPGVTVVDNGTTHTITLTIPQAPDAKKFARLKVVIMP